ncbi:2-octaprenylphenol hydroxylase [Steroidobacter denitrificans]|uniref:2-octaprenylphenol hydroxylase n=1 Tax=Steroidobacter denitrificans TaxID=465721 RepID=A0A127F8E1_STEDE|nr:UbiH/UbiF/VisC/COQ6 family ubiquinone biosynthesis hydroxylase [Steroidobacter denitrificans]AMN46677.1 2-octaprenylphenol hydroxylase [Steroidobacter denitrificans]
MKRPDFHIVVIGGGMVGACVAALSAANPQLTGLRIAMLEAQPPTMPPPQDGNAEIDLRVSAFSRAAERILGSVGAWPLLPAQHICAYDDMVVWDAPRQPDDPGVIRFSAGAVGEPNLGHIIENRRVQWALYECAPFREQVTLLRAELTGLEFDNERAVLSLGDGRRISAMLVIGSDGAASRSRALAGIETRGREYDQQAFVTHVRTERAHGYTAWQRFLPEGPIAFLPLADGRSSIVWTTRPEQARELVGCPVEEVSRQIGAAIGHVLGDVELAGPRGVFPLRLQHAREYCRERFVLVGDAAHAMHPLAGQGVNLGFMDCAALVQILADALSRGARAEAIAELRVLRRYERWRKSENTLALGLIDTLNRVFSNSHPLLSTARRAGLAAVEHSGLTKRFFMGRALGMRGEIPRIASRSAGWS